MNERIDYINPILWFLSRNHELLNLIAHSNMVISTARTLIPDKFFEIKTATKASEVQLNKENLAIVISPENIYQEWLAISSSNVIIGVLQEKELLTHLQNGEHDAIYRKVYEAIRKLG